MRLLVLTQIMDRSDPTLGFFVPWVSELAQRVESVEVLCLKKGEFSLPQDVRVHSLGKERMRLPRFLARILYVIRFYRLLFALKPYEAVFVHMNEEYVLLGGLFWRALGKRVYFWRNHYGGSWKTDIAVSLSTKSFCTSRYSYTARFKKTVRMPTGVNVESLNPQVPVARVPHSILSLARLTPSKRPELLLEAYALLAARGVNFTAWFVGGEEEPGYQAKLEALAKELGVSDQVQFKGPVANTETFREYRAAEVFVNASPSGMLDKTSFKAMAAGAMVLVSSKDLAKEVSSDFVFADNDVKDLALKLEKILSYTEDERACAQEAFRKVVEKHRLPTLADRLVEEMEK